MEGRTTRIAPGGASRSVPAHAYLLLYTFARARSMPSTCRPTKKRQRPAPALDPTPDAVNAAALAKLQNLPRDELLEIMRACLTPELAEAVLAHSPGPTRADGTPYHAYNAAATRRPVHSRPVPHSIFSPSRASLTTSSPPLPTPLPPTAAHRTAPWQVRFALARKSRNYECCRRRW